MKLITCPHCSVRVVVMADGNCPSCRRPFDGDVAGENTASAVPTSAEGSQDSRAELQSARSGPGADVDTVGSPAKRRYRKIGIWLTITACACAAIYLGLFNQFNFPVVAAAGVYKIRFLDRASLLAAVKLDPNVWVSEEISTKLDSVDEGYQSILENSERRFKFKVVVTRRLTPWQRLWVMNEAIPMSYLEFFDGLERAIDKSVATSGTQVREIVRPWDDSREVPLDTMINAGASENSVTGRLSAVEFLQLRTELRDQDARCPETVSSRVVVTGAKLEADDLVVMDQTIKLDPIVQDRHLPMILSEMEQHHKSFYGQVTSFRRRLNAGIQFRYRFFTPAGKPIGEYTLTAANIDQGSTNGGDHAPQAEQGSLESIWEDWIQQLGVPAN